MIFCLDNRVHFIVLAVERLYAAVLFVMLPAVVFVAEPQKLPVVSLKDLELGDRYQQVASVVSYNGPRKPDRKTGEVKSKTMVQRRNFSSEFKTKVVLELLREEETVSQIAAKHKIHHSVLKKWKNTATEGLPGLFADPRKKSAEEIDTESTISDLYKQVGLLSMQLEWLKKKCGIDSFS